MATTDDSFGLIRQEIDAIRERRIKAVRPEVTAEQGERDRQHRVAEAVQALMVQLGIRYAPIRAALETFRQYDRAQTPILERLRRLDVAATVRDGEGLVFLGLVGTGKDHLLAAMLYAAVRAGISCHWMNGQEFYGDLRDGIQRGRIEGQALRDLEAPDVLAISDPVPAAGEASAFNLTQLGRLLDRRYRSLKSTWVTLNATNEDNADERLTAPVWDRLRENAHIFKCFWPSFRERAKG